MEQKVPHNLGRDKSQIPPEFMRAFQNIKSRLHSLSPRTTIPREAIQQDKIFSIRGRFATPKYIPKEEHWRWNQSGSRHSVKGEYIEVKIIKLTVRRKNSSVLPSALPRFKLWVFNVTSHGHKDFHILWCEKGFIVEEQNCPPKLEELSFLSKFMTPDNARFFWPNVIS